MRASDICERQYLRFTPLLLRGLHRLPLLLHWGIRSACEQLGSETEYERRV